MYICLILLFYLRNKDIPKQLKNVKQLKFREYIYEMKIVKFIFWNFVFNHFNNPFQEKIIELFFFEFWI